MGRIQTVPVLTQEEKHIKQLLGVPGQPRVKSPKVLPACQP